MINLKNFALGLLVSFVAVSASFSANTVIGSYQAPAQTADTTGSKGKEGGGETLPISNTGEGAGTNDPLFEKKLNDTLTNNPEILVRALQKYNQSQQRAQLEKLEASLSKYKDEISKESNAVVLGKKDAEVKLVVFLDPNCQHCRSFSQAINKARTNYPNISILVRSWPILGKDSEEVVRGLWAIKAQGAEKYTAAMKEIASTQEPYTYSKLLAWVKDHKLDVAKFGKDSESTATKAVIEETRKLATDIGLEGTPTSLMIDQKGIRLVIPTDEKSLENILKSASPEAPAKA
jgi:protein-disulfide isomerase